MNEIIKQLIQQATTIHYSGLGEQEILDSEKLVKLVARECADLAGCNAHVSGFQLGDLLLKHFGIDNESGN